MRYLQPIELLRLTVFPLQDFQAHNNILWLFSKVGAVGFFFFWLFVHVTAFRGAMLVTTAEDPYFKAVAAMVVVALINQLIAAYFDLHLVWYRVMFYLGLLMGLVQALENIQKREKTDTEA
jgi:prolipoprotein diacylglyceryltransferase